MARRRSRSLTSRYKPQAKLEAQLRYGPQKRALGQALGEAGSQRDQAIAAAHGTSRGLRATIKAQRPEFKEVYGTAGRQLRANSRVVDANMPTSQAANSIATAAQTEHQSALDRNTVARRDTLADLGDQIIRAREGEAFAVRQAGTQYRGDASKIIEQLIGVKADQGAYTAAELGRLVDAARGRRVTLRGQTLAHRDRVAGQQETQRHNRAGEQTAAARAKGDGFAPRGDQNDAQDAIHQALDYAKDFVKHGASREEAAGALRRGVPDTKESREPVIDQATGKQKIDRNGHKVYTVTPAIPGVPKIDSDVFVRAALDVAYQGFLTRGTQQALRKRGIRVGALGVPTYNSGRARRIREQRDHPVIHRPANAPGANGQSRPT